MAAYERQARQAQQLEELRALQEKLEGMLSIHKETFPPAHPPAAPPPEPVDVAAIKKRHRREASKGISIFKRRERREARHRALELAEQEIASEQRGRQESQKEAQRLLNDEWEKLLGNDPTVVLSTLEEAFADNEAPAVPVDCQEDRVTILMLMDGLEAVPERVPKVTPAGKPSSRKLNKTERNELYLAWISSNLLATVREALAVAPSIQEVTTVVLRRDPMTPFGERHLTAVYAGTLSREQCDQIVWDRPEALDAIFHAGNLLLETKGRTKELSAIDLKAHPDLAALVDQVGESLSQERVDAAASSFDVTLVAPGAKVIAVIKEIHDMTGWGLREARRLVDTAPSTLLSGVDRATASAAEERLSAVGGGIEIETSPQQGG